MRKRTVSNEQHGPRRRLPPEILTDAEVCALMRACSRHAPTGLRNRALIALLHRAGLRINEALSLYPKDLELGDGSVRVLNGKGGRSRTVGLDPGAAAIIERWLDGSVSSPRGVPASAGTEAGQTKPCAMAYRGLHRLLGALDREGQLDRYEYAALREHLAADGQ